MTRHVPPRSLPEPMTTPQTCDKLCGCQYEPPVGNDCICHPDDCGGERCYTVDTPIDRIAHYACVGVAAGFSAALVFGLVGYAVGKLLQRKSTHHATPTRT